MSDEDDLEAALSPVERGARLRRRAFLARSALASGALVAGAGCGAAFPQSSLTRGEARELLARLERGLDRVRSVPRGAIARELTWQARPDRGESIIRHTIEALVVSDVARSLPEGRVEGPLAARLTEELPVLQRATVIHHALLSRMPTAARAGLDRRLRREPDIPTDVAAWIDRHAAELGTGMESRLKLRRAAHDVGVRARRQSAAAVIDDAVAKVERVVGRSGGAAALARARDADALLQGVWDQLGDGRGAGGALASPTGAPPGVVSPEDYEWEGFLNAGERFWSADWRRPGDEEMRIGTIMMPFGAISCGLMAIIGLIVLIAGLVQNGDWDGIPRNPR